MISVCRILIFPILICLSIGCEEPLIEPSNSETGLRILPIGDSRVEGARPDFESYRYELWKSLLSKDWDIDFVGENKDEASYPSFQGKRLDIDHEGYGGAQTTDILDRIEEMDNDLKPELVLLGIGGNDLIDTQKPETEIVENIGLIIQNLQSKYGSLIIFVEQIAPARSDLMSIPFQKRFEAFNSLIAELATNYTTNTSKVVIVDMQKDWSDQYMADAVHYNEAGARRIAELYLQSIETHVIR